MKKKISFLNNLVFLSIPLLLVAACASSEPINFAVASPTEIKSLNYLKYNSSYYDSKFLYSYIEGLFHSAPADNAGSIEVLEMTNVNNNQGLVLKELSIQDNSLDLDRSINGNDINNINIQINKLIPKSNQIISRNSAFWYGVAKDIFVINYGNSILNSKNRIFKEFIIKLRTGNIDDRKLPYKDKNGNERWNERPALWHDLKPVTAYDFENSLNYVLNIKNASSNIDYLADKTKGGIKNAKAYIDAQRQSKKDDTEKFSKNLGFKAIGEDLLYVNFETEFGKSSPQELLGEFISKIFHPSLLPSRSDIINKYGDRFGTSAETSIGNGAFKIKRSDFSSETIFTKNYDYWDRNRISSRLWRYKIVKDTFTSATLFESGEVGHSNVTNTLLPRFKSKANLRMFLSQGMSFSSSQFLTFNNENHNFIGEEGKLLKNAINYSINRENALIAQDNGGAVTPDTLTSPYTLITNGNNSTWRETIVDGTGRAKYQVNLMNDEKVPLAYYTTGQRRFYAKLQANIDRTDRLYRPKIAKKFFEQYLKLTNKSKVNLTLLYDTSQSENVDQIIYLKQEIEQNLNKIKINLRPQAKSVFLGELNSGQFDIAQTSRSAKSYEPFEYLNQFSKVYYDVDSHFNKSLRYSENPTGNWQFYDYIKKYPSYDKLKNSNTFFTEFTFSKNDFLWLYALFKPFNDMGDNFATNGLMKNQHINQFQQLNKKLEEEINETNVLQTIFTPDTKLEYPNQSDGDKAINGLGSQMPPHISFRIYSILEAILKIESPIAVLSNSTAGWFVQKIIGQSSGAGGEGKAEVQWAYNCDNKPKDSLFNLKGCEVYMRKDLWN